MTWTTLEPGAHVAMWCATEGCWGIPFHHLEVDGIGSNYCSVCRTKIELLNPPMENSEETGNARAAPAMTGPLPVAGAPTHQTVIDGCVVHGDAPMTGASRAAMREVIAAVRTKLG